MLRLHTIHTICTSETKGIIIHRSFCVRNVPNASAPLWRWRFARCFPPIGARTETRACCLAETPPRIVKNRPVGTPQANLVRLAPSKDPGKHLVGSEKGSLFDAHPRTVMPPYKQTDMVGPSGSGEKAGSRLEVSAGPSSLGTRKAAAVPVRTKSGLKRKPGPGRTCNKFTKTGRMRQCRDPAAPKRARTAFNFFLRDFRKTYLVSHAWNLPRLPSRPWPRDARSSRSRFC